MSPRAIQPEVSRSSRGVRFGGETLTFIPASAKIRPLRDVIILEPIDVLYSRHLLVDHYTKPLKGRVLAIGPGTYPKRYDHRDKHQRTKIWDSKTFVPTEVKVGDEVELGGAEIEGYAFETFWWGDKLCLWCTERDVAGVVDPEPLDPRPVTGPQTLQQRNLHRHASRGRTRRQDAVR